MKPVWNVLIENVNTMEIEKFNIFDHCRFKEDFEKAWKKYGCNLKEFEEQVKKCLMYYFWSKCEYEVEVASIVGNSNRPAKKIDVYQQVMMNFEAFIFYSTAVYGFSET